ncbi:DUF3800 domain-containing protein [Spiroplasma diminutum]|uniref:DUF3800 domain-containing protein n=1 Tax=Spiroplasma diminutum CUAS-1 TaxID=1276221 RepID=S5LWK8_9MOLU|nr:DUF3800 domain-containing protein [Spiroplasma diminutum]AGR42154.1 hypothetical protein SDIMI_v3c04500 [Spiroplasma diminutum CUAS-1]
MAKYINFYLDESGNNLSEFFVVGGFYIINDDYSNIQRIESKIRSNILKTEKNIKEFRMNEEKELEQYILIDNPKNHKEVKWNNLSLQNKSFLFENIRNLTQKNISITCNLKNWKSKNNRAINLNAIYNMMSYYLVDRTLNYSNFSFDEEIIIKIFVDQRKSVPKVLEPNEEKKGSKLESLESYIITQMYWNSQFTNISIKVKQYESNANPLIRYSDYYVGLISSMCRFLNNSKKPWDNDIDKMFELMHKKISCSCHYTIKEQCQTISKLCLKCKLIDLF